MPISVACQGCGRLFRVKDELAGKRVKCPHCGAVQSVPQVLELAELSKQPADPIPRQRSAEPPEALLAQHIARKKRAKVLRIAALIGLLYGLVSAFGNQNPYYRWFSPEASSLERLRMAGEWQPSPVWLPSYVLCSLLIDGRDGIGISYERFAGYHFKSVGHWIAFYATSAVLGAILGLAGGACVLLLMRLRERPPVPLQLPIPNTARVRPTPEQQATAAEKGSTSSSAPNASIKPSAAASSYAGVHLLTASPVGRLIPFAIVTFGIGPTIWLNLMHGKLPPRRRDDPTASRAIGFLFIPYFNLYWYFFTYFRLLTRLNEQRAAFHLPPMRFRWLVLVIFGMMFVPFYGAVVNLLLLVPLLLTAVQSSVNSLVEVSRSRSGSSAGATLAAELRAGRDQRRAWGWYLLVLSIPIIALITPFYLFPHQLGGDRLALGHLAVVVAFPLLGGGISSLWRSTQMNRALADLGRDPGAVETVWDSEVRTSARLHFVWAFACLVVAGAVALPLVGKITETFEGRARLRAEKETWGAMQREMSEGRLRFPLSAEEERILDKWGKGGYWEEADSREFGTIKATDLLLTGILGLPWLVASIVLFRRARSPTEKGGGSAWHGL